MESVACSREPRSLKKKGFDRQGAHYYARALTSCGGLCTWDVVHVRLEQRLEPLCDPRVLPRRRR